MVNITPAVFNAAVFVCAGEYQQYTKCTTI